MRNRIMFCFFRKLPLGLLVFSFLFYPIAPIFAEGTLSVSKASVQIAPAEISPAQTSTLAVQASSGTLELNNQVNNQIKNLQNSNQQDTSTSPLIPLQPESPTTLKQSLPTTDLATGALSYNYPFTFPHGRASMTPDVSIGYNNQSTENGIVGYDWSLNIPYIERQNKKGSDALYNNFSFTSSLSGELAQVSPTKYAPKSDDLSLTYNFSGNVWQVFDKNENTYTFGLNTDSRQDDPNNSAHIFKWMLEEMRDINGNSIKYTYIKNTGEIYPNSITYTNHGVTQGIFEINFLYEARPDAPVSYSPVFKVVTNYRISEIDAKINGEWLKKYKLAYTLSDIGISFLSSITESGKNTSNTITTLPPTTFTYQNMDGGWSLDTSFKWPVDQEKIDTGSTSETINGAPAPYSINTLNGQTLFADVNGDGLTDMIHSGPICTDQYIAIYGPNSCGPSGARTGKYFYINTGSGFKLDTSWHLPVDQNKLDLGDNTTINGLSQPVDLSTLPGHTSPRIFIDVNGDNRVDIIENAYPCTDQNIIGNPSYCNPGGVRTGKYVYINNGVNGWTLNPNWSWPGDQESIDMGDLETVSGKPIPLNLKLYDGTSVISDLNGDGLPDITQSGWTCTDQFIVQNGNACGPNGAHAAKYVYLNTGSGWTLDSSWKWPVDQNNIDNGSSQTVNGEPLPLNVIFSNSITYPFVLADVNGDGLLDIINNAYTCTDQMTTCGSAGSRTGRYVYLNTGSGWTYDASWPWPYDGQAIFMGNTSTVNGNPLPFSINRSSLMTMPADGSNDGIIDFIHSGPTCDDSQACGTNGSYTGKYVYANNAHGWQQVAWNWPADQNIIDNGNSQTVNGNSYPLNITERPQNGTPTILADVNGDRAPDILHSAYSCSDQYLMSYGSCGPGGVRNGKYIYKNTSVAPFLNKITYPEGGSAIISYKYSAQYTDQSGNLLNPNLPMNVATVSTLTQDDGNGNISITSYTYTGGYYYYGNSFDRKFAGFAKVTKTDAVGTKTVTYFHQGNDTNSAFGEYDDQFSKIGRPYRTEIYDSAGKLYQVVINKWDRVSEDANRDFVKLISTVTETYDGNLTHKDTAQEFSYDDMNGNLIQKINYGEVLANSDGSFTDVGADKTIENITYATGGANLTGFPADDIILDGGGNKIHESRFYYDNLPLGSVSLGNQTKTENWKEGTTYVNTQKSYNNLGLLVSQTDGRGNTTTYTYDDYNLYPKIVTDALQHSINSVYDYALGKVLQTTDQNNFIYQTIYDGLGRPIEEKTPDPLTGLPVTKTTYVYDDTPGEISIQKTDYLDDTTPVNTYSYFDGLDRLIQDRKSTENADVYAVRDLAYDNRGLLQKESLPYFSNGVARTDPTTNTALYTIYTYDPMQRAASSTNILGSTTTTYDNFETTVTNANGKTKNYYKDALGNLVKVEEHNGADTYTTLYDYDLQGNLIKITDALGNVRNFAYDNLGERLTAEDLHALGDTSFGVWSYTYDDAGNLIQTTNPNGQTTVYTFDELNRPLTESLAGSTDVQTSYNYDTCLNGVGKLCSVTMQSGVDSSYEYNSAGAVSNETKIINSNVFNTAYQYDRQGNVTNLKYPDEAEISNTYNAGGLLEKIERKESGGAWNDVVSNITYSPTGQIASMDYANGVTTINNYDPMQMYRLINKQTTNASGTNLQNLTYTYDAMGNITQTNDASNTDTAKTTNYAYDDLNRLVAATTGNAINGQNYTQIYNYDAIGNILNKSDEGDYLYNGNVGNNFANPHAVTNVGAVQITYDGAGNMLWDGNITNYWNYKNQLTNSILQGKKIFYRYDQDGNRVLMGIISSKFNGSQTNRAISPISTNNADTYYPNKFYNATGDQKTKQIFAGNNLVATIETNDNITTPYYVSTDNVLGSNVVTDDAGNPTETLDYYPYGAFRLDEKTTNFNEQNKFGGHQHDAATSFDYFGARYYNGAWGKFLSEDPSFLALGDTSQTKSATGQDLPVVLSNPQSLNSYSYAENSPIIKIDLDGKFVSPIDAALTVGFLAYDAYKISQGGFTQQNSSRLGLDSMGLIPFVPGFVGDIVKISEVASDASKAMEEFKVAKMSALDKLPGCTLVCRGVEKGQEAFTEKELKTNINGKIMNASVFVDIENKGTEALLDRLPSRYERNGVFSTLDQLRGNVKFDPQGLKPDHFNLNEFTKQEGQRLFNK